MISSVTKGKFPNLARTLDRAVIINMINIR